MLFAGPKTMAETNPKSRSQINNQRDYKMSKPVSACKKVKREIGKSFGKTKTTDVVVLMSN